MMIQRLDILLDQLRNLENLFPDLSYPDSPSHRVGGEPVAAFNNVRHNHPMLSLSNLYAENDLKSWVLSLLSRLSKSDIATVCEVKIDGLAISVIYEKGFFRQAITRGNGEIGDDVSSNVKTIRGLPLQLKGTG